MIAVIMTGGKQHKVREGDVLEIEKIGVETGRTFDFKNVLLIAEGSKVTLGTPFIDGAAVRADILENIKGDKIVIFKKKRRKQYKRMKGHRQSLVRVRVTDIIPDLAHPPEKKAAPPVEKPAPIPAVKKPQAVEKPKSAKKEKPAPAKPAREAKPEKARAKKAPPHKKEPAKAASKKKRSK